MYRLLIVDESPENCEKIQSALDWPSYGFTSILTADSYHNAVSLAMDFSPHAAFVNIRLGDYWGYDLVSHLHGMGCKTVFCIISKVETCEYLRKSMEASAQDFLVLPINPDALSSFVKRTVLRELHGSFPDKEEISNRIDPVLLSDCRDFSKITQKIILIIKGDCRNSQSLTRIAETFHMNSKYIGRVFQKDTGMKFNDYLTAYRMMVAKHLLESTQEKVSSIAESVGYSQLNNFYTHFKKHFGISPGAMRAYGSRGRPDPQ